MTLLAMKNKYQVPTCPVCGAELRIKLYTISNDRFTILYNRVGDISFDLVGNEKLDSCEFTTVFCGACGFVEDVEQYERRCYEESITLSKVQ